MQRVIYIVTVQIKSEKNPKPELPESMEQTEKDKIIKDWQDSFMPHYNVCTTRLQMEKLIKKFSQQEMVNYKVTETLVDSYALPDFL